MPPKRALKGGKLHIQDMKKFVQNSYQDPSQQAPDIAGFLRDDALSGRRSQTYHDPMTGKAVVIHRGSQGATDWLNNALVPFGLYASTDRYKYADEAQKKAESKYGSENVETIGHSIGAHIATGVGKDSSSIIGYNRPPQYSQLPAQYQDVKRTRDPFFPFTSSGKKTIIMPSQTFNPVSEHSAKAIEDHNDIIVGRGRGKKHPKKNKFLTEKNIKNFEKPLKNVMKKLSLHSEHRLLGSGSLDHIVYVSDYDLQNKLQTTKGLATKIKNLIESIDKQSDTWFVDLKAGEDTTTKKGLHWTYDEIKQMKKDGVTLQEAIDQHNTVCKIDVVMHVDGKFVAVTELYMKPNDDHLDKTHLAESIEADYNDYLESGNFFKALKRLLSLLRLTAPDSHIIDALVAFFDSNCGLANAVKNDLEVMVELLSSKQRHKKVPVELIRETIQSLKQQLNAVFIIPISQSMFGELDAVSEQPSAEKIQKLVDELKDAVNEYTEHFLKKNKHIFAPVGAS